MMLVKSRRIPLHAPHQCPPRRAGFNDVPLLQAGMRKTHRFNDQRGVDASEWMMNCSNRESAKDGNEEQADGERRRFAEAAPALNRLAINDKPISNSEGPTGWAATLRSASSMRRVGK